MEEWIDRCMDRCVDRWMGGRMDRWVGRWVDEWMDGKMSGWMSRWMGQGISECVEGCIGRNRRSLVGVIKSGKKQLDKAAVLSEGLAVSPLCSCATLDSLLSLWVSVSPLL